MPNVLMMLKSDHATVKRLLRELNETADRATKQRERLCSEIEREVKIHSQLEEELFYPAFLAAAEKKRADDELFYEATEEHHVVDMVLPALKAANPKSKEFAAKAKVLKDLLEHHIREEEGEMFRQARTLLNDGQLRALGDEMQARKETLVAMWTNPISKPAKKLQSAAQKLLPAKLKNAKAIAIARKRETEGEEAR
jgi:hemerythrin-like domain-containing protein